MRSKLSTRTVFIVVTAAAMLTACVPSGSNHDKFAEPTAIDEGATPEFEGAFADEFADFYTKAESEFVREALRDGQITDSEYAEMTSNLTTCLADQGITFDGFRPDGGYSTSLAPNGGDTHAIVSKCSQSSGESFIGALYNFMRRNPDNLDEAAIMVECLVREGVVPQDYSADEFSQDNTGRFADFASLSADLQEALVSCSSDPLGLLD